LAVGIDDVYSGMPHQDDEPLGNAFDITWLTIVCISFRRLNREEAAGSDHRLKKEAH